MGHRGIPVQRNAGFRRILLPNVTHVPKSDRNDYFRGDDNHAHQYRRGNAEHFQHRAHRDKFLRLFNLREYRCGATLGAGSNCAVSIKFTPALIGSKSAAISFTDDAPGSPQTVPLAGIGVNTIPIPIPHRPVLMGMLKDN